MTNSQVSPKQLNSSGDFSDESPIEKNTREEQAPTSTEKNQKIRNVAPYIGVSTLDKFNEVKLFTIVSISRPSLSD